MDSSSPLVKKLSHLMPFSDEDVRVLNALSINEERFEADTDIMLQGAVPRSAFVLTHGIAFRYRLLSDGKRQILTFMIPGDVFGLHAFLLRAMDHSIATLVPTRLATISRARVFDLFEHHPRIGATLWWSALQEEAINRERIVALGRRSARGRVAYLLCELVCHCRSPHPPGQSIGDNPKNASSFKGNGSVHEARSCWLAFGLWHRVFDRHS
jgi:CRP-like cAMP-binding protein